MARYLLPVSLLSELVFLKPKLTGGGYNLYLQQGAGNYEDSEEIDPPQQSEDSQNSQETNSSQEEKAPFNPWSRTLDETEQRHEAQLDALINK